MNITSAIVKQLYTRAMGVPQVGHACRDPLGVWEDFFEQLHQELTSSMTCVIIDKDQRKAIEQ